jgi:hypothetical protein
MESIMRLSSKSSFLGGVAVLAGIAVLVTSVPVVAQPAEPPPPAPPPAAPDTEAKAPATAWYEGFQAGAFIDAYASVNYNFPKPQTGANARVRAYDVTNGFALAWAGVDVGRAPEPVGGQLSLRFGPSAQIYNAGSDANTALTYVKQAYASFKPGGAEGTVTLDFGKFDTWFGAEVADSQLNQNYTRGVLYWLAQPLFHTGLRATWQATDTFALKGGIVNGWNNSLDNNIGKSYAAQIAWAPAEQVSLALGWIGGPEQPDVVVCAAGEAFDPATSSCVPDPASAGITVDRGGANDFDAWRHLVDLVVTAKPSEALALVMNLDYGVEGIRVQDDPADPTRIRADGQAWYGGMLGARYQLSEVWAVAGRGEYYADPDGKTTGVEGLSLLTGTLTLEAAPTSALLIRLEQRADVALGADADGAEEIFQREERDTSSSMITTTLGVVVRTP